MADFIKRENGLSTRERLEKYTVYETNGGCWLWAGYWNERGYGTINISGSMRLVHRVSYEIHKGPIPDNLTIDHLCNVQCCINPAHLEAVTQVVNIRRAGASGLLGSGHRKKTHCPKGHPYSGENLFFETGGGYRRRCCRACRSDYNRRAALNRKAKQSDRTISLAEQSEKEAGVQ